MSSRKPFSTLSLPLFSQEAVEAFAQPWHVPDLTQYDWIVVNTSAGKDSLIMSSDIARMAEAAGVLDRVVSVHACLGRVEWPETAELAQEQAEFFGFHFLKVWRRQGDLLQQVEARGMWPGPDTRYCTAHHKQNQVQRVFTALSGETRKEHIAPRDGDLLQQIEQRGMFPDRKRRFCTSDQKRLQVQRAYTLLTHLTRNTQDAETCDRERNERKASIPRVRILSCLGMRADESPARAKKKAFIENDPVNSNGRRQVDTWLAIHRMREAQVWQEIKARGLYDAGLVHYAYDLGMPRLSCVFCIFAPFDALVLAGYHNPGLLAEYVRVEEVTGHRFRIDFSMAEVAAAVASLLASGAKPKGATNWKM